MSEPTTVELRVLGHNFRLSTSPEQQEDLERAAELLNDKYEELRRKAPRMEPSKLMIMLSLELMQEVLGLNKSLQQYEHCERLLSNILQELDVNLTLPDTVE